MIAGLPSFSTMGSGSCHLGGSVSVQEVTGGLWPMVLADKRSQAPDHGQCLGRRKIGFRCGRHNRAGRLTILRVASPLGREYVPTCKYAGGAQQIVGDRRAEHPRGVRSEASRRHVRQRAVEEVGEDGFDDRVPAMGSIGVVGRGGGVGEERMMPPYREQRVGVAGVFDAAHDQPGGDRSLRRSESGVGGFGDLGVFRSTLRFPGRGPLPGTSPGSTARRESSR